MKAVRLFLSFLVLVSAILLPVSVLANQAGLDASIEALKSEVVELNQELFELEERLLYPAMTSFSVFVSMEAVQDYEIKSIKLNLDEQDVTSYLYSKEQVEALRRGGIQKIYQGNLKPGLHKLSAEILGKGHDGRIVKRTIVADFGKTRASKYLEVKISHHENKNKPEFAIVEWK